jgi:hypothetical protein
VGAYGARSNDDAAEGRAIINAWAKKHGFDSVDAYAQARGVHWSVLYAECCAGILKDSPLAKGIKGVLRQTTEFIPNPEEMAASRRNLGIPEP